MEFVMIFPFVAFGIFIGMFLGGGKGDRNWFAGCALVFMILLTLFVSAVAFLMGR